MHTPHYWISQPPEKYIALNMGLITEVQELIHVPSLMLQYPCGLEVILRAPQYGGTEVSFVVLCLCGREINSHSHGIKISWSRGPISCGCGIKLAQSGGQTLVVVESNCCGHCVKLSPFVCEATETVIKETGQHLNVMTEICAHDPSSGFILTTITQPNSH